VERLEAANGGLQQARENNRETPTAMTPLQTIFGALVWVMAVASAYLAIAVIL
jgi:hypothetical protein